MLELCMISTYRVEMGFSNFLRGKFRHRVMKHGVGVECDPRSTAA